MGLQKYRYIADGYRYGGFSQQNKYLQEVCNTSLLEYGI